jgi:hypothetical protein
MRNRIYRYVLVKAVPIQPTIVFHKEPGMLQTCRQIRREASKILYTENTFILRIHNLRLEPGPEHWV